MKNSLITFGLFNNLNFFSHLARIGEGTTETWDQLLGSPEFISPQIMQVKSNSLINTIFKVMTFSLRFNIFLVGVGEAIPVCNIPWMNIRHPESRFKQCLSRQEMFLSLLFFVGRSLFLSFLFGRIFPTNPSPSPKHKMSGQGKLSIAIQCGCLIRRPLFDWTGSGTWRSWFK